MHGKLKRGNFSDKQVEATGGELQSIHVPLSDAIGWKKDVILITSYSAFLIVAKAMITFKPGAKALPVQYFCRFISLLLRHSLTNIQLHSVHLHASIYLAPGDGLR